MSEPLRAAPLRAAVVGLGAMGRHHARLLAELPGVRLVAACDADRARAEEHAALRGCAALTSADELGDVDLVVVATPTSAHREVAVPLLRRGVACLVEKPLAATLADADAMLEAAASGKALLATGHSERYNPALGPVLPLAGKPLFVESHRLGVFPGRSLDVDVVLDLMIHDLDLLLWLTGSELVDVAAIGVNVLTPRVDIANARLDFASGCIANVTASRVSADPTRKLRVFTERSYVSIDLVNQTSEVHAVEDRGGTRSLARRVHEPPAGPRPEPLRRELEAVVAAIRGGPSDVPTGLEGRRAVEAALRVLASMEQHRERMRRLAG